MFCQRKNILKSKRVGMSKIKVSGNTNPIISHKQFQMIVIYLAQSNRDSSFSLSGKCPDSGF